MQIIINSLVELDKFAANIAQKLEAGMVVCLRGDLGAGKTTLSRSLIRHITKNHNLEITSPTFNLVHLYNAPRFKIWHFDLYRLKTAEEVYELGIDDAFNELAIIEWPEIIENILPSNKIDILIEIGENENSRIITMNNYHD
ncbi:tRNA (adenosine(37)-N6)-threonylcarbamoyltransferase complex ATPase subunit type 1 TsaE [Candidatus Jidaibacter acanthamoebae]|nr:tRNA (adenosine(37)-N6)-threonylcarbamoyltransferase complex ATPase subunit type 1 TsaE [Candidatus Jidaibacter acanthamoeba]